MLINQWIFAQKWGIPKSCKCFLSIHWYTTGVLSTLYGIKGGCISNMLVSENRLPANHFVYNCFIIMFPMNKWEFLTKKHNIYMVFPLKPPFITYFPLQILGYPPFLNTIPVFPSMPRRHCCRSQSARIQVRFDEEMTLKEDYVSWHRHVLDMAK